MKDEILYWLAKHGIVEYRGKYVIADSWYIKEKEVEEDSIIYYYGVSGWQLPFMKKVNVPLMHDSRYERLIQQKVKRVGQF